MGIFGAMTTAVSGLSAQAYALENISGNIANSQTTAFKRIETAFVDLIPDSGPKRELSGSVTGYSRATNTIQGQISATSITTNLAINGDGYFVVQQPSGFVDGQPTFATTNAYTRRGDFTVDANGYMVNGAGYYLRGLPLDRTTGNPLGSSPVPIQITNDVIPARATDKIKYRASLPTVPKTAQANATAGSELMDSGLIGDATINSTDAPNFVATSVSGGSITAFDSLGNEVNVQIRWAKTANAAAGPPPVSDTWSAYYQSNSTSGAEPCPAASSTLLAASTSACNARTSGSPAIKASTASGCSAHP